MKISFYLKYLLRSLFVQGRSSFFKDGYKFLHPECGSNGMTPWQHYVTEGMDKGFGDGTTPPETMFFREGYLLEYPDVKAAGLDPWRHYVLNGRKEGRDNGLHPHWKKQFFAAGYLEMYPDVRASGADPWHHYVLHGKKEGRDNGMHPNAAQFFAEGYLEMYPDVKAAGVNPWYHYVLDGKKEGRDNGLHPDSKKHFFAAGYLEMYPAVKNVGAAPWHHYVLNGKKEGRDNGLHPKSTMFFPAGYLEMYPDVKAAGADPWHHYVLNGKKEGRGNGLHPDWKKQFFAAGYLEMYPDVKAAGVDPWRHYVLNGKKEGRDNGLHPDREKQFFPEGYLEMYPDVKAAGADPWRHYVLNGKREGRDSGLHPKEGQFFAGGYLEMYPDVRAAGVDPWHHYVLNGKKEGRDNGLHPKDGQFFLAGYLEMYPDIKAAGVDPWRHYVQKGKKEGRSNCCLNFTHYSDWIYDVHENKNDFVDNDGHSYSRKRNDPKIFAYYLPQFHTIPVNDANFGKGFTEWTNVARSTPLFYGHVQPRIPYDLGFYNLDDARVIKRQAELAKQFGIYGFCFYYYWFSGEKVLEKPLKSFLDSDIDFNFHLMWADENWAKLWDGGNKEVILEQKFDASMIDDFYRDISPYIKDRRYEKVSNRPILAVYKPALFGRELFESFVSRMNELAVKDGFNGFYFLGTNASNFSEPEEYNLKGIIEFPPHGMRELPKITDVEWFNYKRKTVLYDLHTWVENRGYLNSNSYSTFKCCFPSWDNSPRKAYTGSLIYMMQKDDFYNWLTGIILWTREHHKKNEQYVYINAWNEWGEGAFLEPDTKLGYKSLVTVRKAIEDLALS